jgi:hypothetical protein
MQCPLYASIKEIKRVQLHAAGTLPSRKDSQVPLERRLEGTQSQSGCGSEEKSLPLPII